MEPSEASIARVVSVASDAGHAFSKPVRNAIDLVAGLGVAGDAHFGATVQHRSRVAVDPTQPNLRQVHLIHRELFAELATDGFAIAPGDLGENIQTEGIDLLALPTGAKLHIGPEAIVEITGLRNPCRQIEEFRSGLLSRLVTRRDDGTIERKAGVMGVVLSSGTVIPGAQIIVEMPSPPFRPLDRV